jgi:hypothetical protein
LELQLTIKGTTHELSSILDLLKNIEGQGNLSSMTVDVNHGVNDAPDGIDTDELVLDTSGKSLRESRKSRYEDYDLESYRDYENTTPAQNRKQSEIRLQKIFREAPSMLQLPSGLALFEMAFWDYERMEILYQRITPDARLLLHLLCYFQSGTRESIKNYVTSNNMVFGEALTNDRVFPRADSASKITAHSVGGWLSSISKNLASLDGAGEWPFEVPSPVTRSYQQIETPSGPVKSPIYGISKKWIEFLSSKNTPEVSEFRSHLDSVIGE